MGIEPVDEERIDRRRFLGRGALVAAGVGATVLTGCSPDEDKKAATEPTAAVTGGSPASDLSTWEGIRAEFLLDPEIAHLEAFLFASHPAPVRAAIEEWRVALDKDPAMVVAGETENDQAVRDAAGRYLGVLPDEVALTDSTTMGLGLAYGGFKLAAGDHVLTSTHDFYSTHESLRLAAERSGAELEKIPLYDEPENASAAQMVERVRAAIRPTTRLVALTWVHSSTGVKIPVRAIADVLSEANEGRAPAERAIFCLDSVHGLAAEDTVPTELGCDVLIAGTHKWLFGPRGTGIIWARTEVWDRFSAIIPTFSGPSVGAALFGETNPFVFGLDGTPGGYHSFEHRWALVDAFDFHLRIGKVKIADRTRELATQLKDGLTELDGLRLITPRDPEISSGLVCCEVPGIEPGNVFVGLREEHKIASSVTPYAQQYTRFGPSIVTMPEEVDATIRAMETFLV